MTDRELLEAAAKAAGYKKYYAHYLGRDSFVTYDDEYYSEVKERRVVGEKTLDWNPLTDDGDALRLAVKLAIDFKIRNEATWWDHQESEGVVYWSHEPHNGDPFAATRRAIVRAAAELGRSKE